MVGVRARRLRGPLGGGRAERELRDCGQVAAQVVSKVADLLCLVAQVLLQLLAQQALACAGVRPGVRARGGRRALSSARVHWPRVCSRALRAACARVRAFAPEGERAMADRVGDARPSDTDSGDSEGPASGQTSLLSGRCASRLNSWANRNMDSSCTSSAGGAPPAAPAAAPWRDSGPSTPHSTCSCVGLRSSTAMTSCAETTSACKHHVWDRQASAAWRCSVPCVLDGAVCAAGQAGRQQAGC